MAREIDWRPGCASILRDYEQRGLRRRHSWEKNLKIESCRKGRAPHITRESHRALPGVGPPVLYVPSGSFDKLLGAVMVLIVFGMGLSIVYLFVFNSANRRSLHDIVAGSAVVQLDSSGPPSNWAIARTHWYVIALIVIASIIVPITLAKSIDTSTFSNLVAVHEAIEADPDVLYASVIRTKSFFSADGRTTSHETLNINARLRSNAQTPKDIADRLSDKIYAYPESLVGVEAVSVSLWWGYDIGIASSRRSSAWNYPTTKPSASE
jgi:hypothetical protein